MVTLLLSTQVCSALQWIIWPLSTLKNQPTSYDHTNGPNKLLFISEWNNEGNLIGWATKTASYITIRLNLVRQGFVLPLVFFFLVFPPNQLQCIYLQSLLKNICYRAKYRGTKRSFEVHPSIFLTAYSFQGCREFWMRYLTYVKR